ncbi:hypothetical protein H7849_01095 [Alloacidobacterium dinghuense]|uniref:Uncharacterized protein n=1 Tax=Alloacidobacterium dinghuense TaxID=2763107 RepID=A0A7G8BJC7_9BACT|nr:hypothetical protein [Alloacidobacterium dinghuense]QNI32647.1 hypothetical protein H7849_01095 [Alloacidobacterium dinghuense]
MYRWIRRYAIDLTIVLLGVTSADASNLPGLAQKCARENENSCAVLQKELEKCKKESECLASLALLPDVALDRIAADQKIDSGIRDKATATLAGRKQERAAREQRRNGIQNLRRGMTIAEVEAAIGPIDEKFHKLVNNVASPEVQQAARDGRTEIHWVLSDRGWSQNIGGGDPRNSTESYECSEFTLVFDFEGKLRDFQYRGMP